MNRRQEDIKNILIVDDDRDQLALVSDYISSKIENYKVDCVSSCKQAKRVCLKKSYDIMILDINLPDMNGISFLERFKRETPLTNIIIRTGEDLSVEAEIKLREIGIDDIIKKERGLRLLKVVMRRSIERSQCIKYDLMTNTLMKNLFPSSLSSELQKVNTDRNYKVSLVNIDFNKFKQINDEKGHDVGDKVLIETTSIIRDNIRLTDLIFRMGGDEFYILMPNTCSSEATEIMKRVCLKIKEDKGLEQLCGFKNSISVGIVCACPNEKDTLFVKKSDVAMYGAKRKNKDIVVKNEETGEYEVI